MKTETFFILTRGLIIIGSFLAVIYTFGVVWRVEKKLDLSYKLFLIAIIAFTLSEIISLFGIKNYEWEAIASLILKAVFVVFFLMGILEMRHMIRKIDGEIK